ncbi:MAG: hypothetical protein WC376_02215 [Candidatus Nanoarchaeia archaeon]|jgi:hypothetical protein
MNGITEKLEEMLPIIGARIAKNNKYLSEEEKKEFLENLDSPEQHSPKWHEWGIITHTKKFREMYDNEVQKYLKDWDVKNYTDKWLNEEIDGKKKSELLRISIPLHDLGKFNKQVIYKDGKKSYEFEGHEKESERIIKEDFVKEELQKLGLTENQIKYVAECAGNHYALGIIRKKAKETSLEYTIEFAKSEEFKEIAERSIEKDLEYKDQDIKYRVGYASNPVEAAIKYSKDDKFRIEKGLLFLADSLAKTELRMTAVYNDADIKVKSKPIEKIIEEKGMNKSLINAVEQMPVNTAVAKWYLRNLSRAENKRRERLDRERREWHEDDEKNDGWG